MEIILDTLGSERGSEVAVEAGYQFCLETGSPVCLVGNARSIKTFLGSRLSNRPGLRIVNASESVSMEESADAALTSKQNASIRIAMQQAAHVTAAAVISPGHTGATVIAARDSLGMLTGIDRACLCQILPTSEKSHILLADAGASLNATPEDLYRFGVLAQTTASVLLNIKEPRVALLNIGSESGKGDCSLLEAYALMQKRLTGFIGNVEGHDLWNCRADVVITQGITGNILLKSAEGFAVMLYRRLRNGMGPEMQTRLDFGMHDLKAGTYGGAVLLGVNGTCIVCHGQASQKELFSACELAIKCLNGDLVGKLNRQLIQCGFSKESMKG